MGPGPEIYDPDYSALKLTDPYSYTDPRQFYYAPYVTTRPTGTSRSPRP